MTSTSALQAHEGPGVAPRTSLRKIVYVLPRQDFFAIGRCGRVSHAVGVVSGFRAHGVQVDVVSGTGTRDYFVDLDGVTAHEIAGHARAGIRSRWFAQLMQYVEGLVERDDAIDAVIVRYAISKRGAWTPLMRRHADRIWCLEVNSLAYHHYHRLPGYIRRLMLAVETRALSHADLIYAVSAPLRADIVGANPALADRVVVVPNGGPMRSSTLLPLPRPQHPGSTQTVHFTYLGVFQPYYEFELVVAAFRRLRQSGVDAELHFHGYGPGYEPLQRTCGADSDIRFHGRYALDELARNGMIPDTAVLLLPNRPAGMSEIGSPIKLFEYMTLGRPILAANVGQAASALVHGQTAWLYTPGSVESCAAGMAALAADAGLRADLATRAWQDFAQHHSWAARMRQLADALERVARRPARLQRISDTRSEA